MDKCKCGHDSVGHELVAEAWGIPLDEPLMVCRECECAVRVTVERRKGK